MHCMKKEIHKRYNKILLRKNKVKIYKIESSVLNTLNNSKYRNITSL